MILLIDNYDSFSYNLYQMIGEIEPNIKVIRNDVMTVDEIKKLSPEKIIVSPGPGRPEDAGIIVDTIKQLSPSIPILGVCLGHQAIVQAFQGEITYAERIMHGKQSEVTLDNSSDIFKDLPNSIPVARYHSLIAKTESIPDCLKVTAKTNNNEIMAIQHVHYKTFGLQFHPESILTPDGRKILYNFIKEI